MNRTPIPFTKDEAYDELRVMLLAMASNIFHFGNAKLAYEFIGFEYDFDPADTADEIEREYALKRIELSRFKAAEYLSIAYDYAFQVGHFKSFDETSEFDVIGFRLGVPVGANNGELMEFHLDNGQTSKCRHVVDMAMARWYLDDVHGRGDPLTIRQLALLAGMKEGAVRNSLSAEKIKTEGSPASVPGNIALEWLKKKKGFIPSRLEGDSGERWRWEARTLLATQQFDMAMENILAKLKLTPETTAEKAGVPVKYVTQVVAGTHDIDNLDGLRKIGAALDLDIPHFVGKAVEVALMRSPAI